MSSSGSSETSAPETFREILLWARAQGIQLQSLDVSTLGVSAQVHDARLQRMLLDQTRPAKDTGKDAGPDERSFEEKYAEEFGMTPPTAPEED